MGVVGRCDAVVWVADGQVCEGQDYGERLVERLRARGLRVERRDLTHADGQEPSAPLHVLSGGATSVWDTTGWMPRGLRVTRGLIDGALRDEHAVLGVCLGSQMIAEALWPGSVGSGPRIQVGLVEVTWSPSPGAAERLVVPAFHYEQVDSSRATAGGAAVLAEDLRSGLQGFRVGARVWGVQFHPELLPGDVRRLAAYHRETIETHQYSVESALRSVDSLERRWQPGVFDRILDRVCGSTAGR